MNDRLRFRVWSVREKKMIYNAEIAYDGTNYPTEWQIGENNNDGWICCFGEYINRQEDYEVMQCTGLKDKNGNLIYEGDIVKAFVKDYCFVGYILWDIDRWEIQDVSIPTSFDLYDAFCDENTGHDKNTIEIIGNIHENKELLKGE